MAAEWESIVMVTFGLITAVSGALVVLLLYRMGVERAKAVAAAEIARGVSVMLESMRAQMAFNQDRIALGRERIEMLQQRLDDLRLKYAALQALHAQAMDAGKEAPACPPRS